MTTKKSTHAATALTSAFAAIACSTALLFGTVAPAQAHDTKADARKWQGRVTEHLNSRIRASQSISPGMRNRPAAVMVAEFDHEGRHVTTRLAQSSGHDTIDREAVRIVTTMEFPDLPASLRGRSRVVPVEVFFGNSDMNRHASAVRARSKAILASHRANDVPVGQSQH